MYEISFQVNIDKNIKQLKKTVGVNDANDEMLMCDVRNVN